MLLLIAGRLGSSQPKEDSKTTFVTVNRIYTKDIRILHRWIQKQPLLLLISRYGLFLKSLFSIQKQPLLLLIRDKAMAQAQLEKFKNNLCYC